MKNLTQKTSRKPKKTKKNNIPGLLEKEKCKNQKNLEKTKKNKKNNIPELLSVDPISKLLEYWFFWFFCFFWFSRGFFDFCLFSLFQESWNIGFFCFFGFFGFLEVFLIFAFFLFQESWNIVFFWFFWFFWFSRGFLDFYIFPFPRVLEYCFFCFFLVFSSLYLIFAFFHLQDLCVFFLRFFFQGVFSKTSELSFAWFSQGFCILLVTSLSCLRDMRLVTPICLSLAVHKSKKSNGSLFF